MRLRSVSPLCLCLTAWLIAGGCVRDNPPRADSVCFGEVQKNAPADLEVAPESKRVDLERPAFSKPTEVTNPLFPVAELDQIIMLGEVEGKPFRTEVTLLPETKTIECDGKRIETLVSQYVAWLDGRIHEVALDWYAQADDGAVWYFGEDVFNYEDGVVADTEGTWLAGKDGPPGMIMPAQPKVGDVYRPENIRGVVFEEVTVGAIGQRVDGPRGPIEGAVVMKELHMDGAVEDKTFAPGYGEFLTGGGGDLEAVALAVPIDASPGPAPPELAVLSSGLETDLTAVEIEPLNVAWNALQVLGIPPLLREEMSGALNTLADASIIRQHGSSFQNFDKVRSAAIRVAQAELDLRMKYVALQEIEVARLKLWARQLEIHAESSALGKHAAVKSDVVSLERVWERVGHNFANAQGNRINAQIEKLRAAADDEDLSAVKAALPELISAL